jgi:hypothetical protein
MFEFRPGTVPAFVHDAPHPLRRTILLLIACSASLLAGACAHNTGDVPELQWQFSTAGELPSDALNAAAESPPGSSCGRDTGWSDRCYVYRGGRDPRTGLAYTQL